MIPAILLAVGAFGLAYAGLRFLEAGDKVDAAVAPVRHPSLVDAEWED